jgi:hypothetical protein
MLVSCKDLILSHSSTNPSSQSSKSWKCTKDGELSVFIICFN